MEPQLEAWLAANGKKQADWVDSNWETCDMVTATIDGERVECEFVQYKSNTDKQEALVRVCGAVLNAEAVAKLGSAGLLGGPGIVIDTLKNLDLVKAPTLLHAAIRSQPLTTSLPHRSKAEAQARLPLTSLRQRNATLHGWHT